MKKSAPSSMKIFVSHIHEEAKIAKVLKEWIESTFSGTISVFVSSNIKNIPAGTKWFTEINNALRSSSIFIVLCSPSSLSRPWINFETGCAWIKQVPILPLCHSGITKNELPSPLSIFQGIDMDTNDFIDDLLESLKIHFKFLKLPVLDKKTFQKQLNEAIKSSQNFFQTMKESKQNNKKISDEDALNLIESWMGRRHDSDNKSTIRFLDVDNELNLPEGTTKRLIESAAIRWKYIVHRKGEDTIIFKDAPKKPINRPSFVDWNNY